MGMSNAFVCVMGIGVVFLSLVCIVIICKIMSFLLNTKSESNQPISAISDTKTSVIANKQEILAAVCAVIAHETGAEAKNIRVKSFRKIC